MASNGNEKLSKEGGARVIKREKNGIIYYEFELLAKTGLVNHCFSSRIGGVSKPPYTSMNLAYHMGDNPLDVNKNYQKICENVGFDYKQIKMTKQRHQTGIHVINEEDVCIPEGIDGLITTVTGPVLTTYYADCVPLLFLDPVKKVIANSHAGWRGTMHQMAEKTILRMVDQFDCQPREILVGIGPSISARYFEVEKAVVHEFELNLPSVMSNIYRKSEHKWHIDLSQINHERLIEVGVLAQHIEVADFCTFENEKHFYSHRREGRARGNMAAMIALKS